jgi:predicted ATPase
MFTNLDFTHFRGFDALGLSGLQRVNLIVGRNNAGKTSSLLEGIAILADYHQIRVCPASYDRPQEMSMNAISATGSLHGRPVLMRSGRGSPPY